MQLSVDMRHSGIVPLNEGVMCNDAYTQCGKLNAWITNL